MPPGAYYLVDKIMGAYYLVDPPFFQKLCRETDF